ncbi:MAG: response regulator [Gammaproteobacteria bacterium]|nr:response regulator [Gammaproteobacteria bacterium]
MLNHATESENKIFNILLAEDEPSNQLLMQKMLNLAGHKVTIAENGQEALNYLKTNTYDACIFDMQMPVMSGIEAIVTYKNENGESKTPFIMLTGNTEKKAIEECLQAGVAMYLAKPVKLKKLLEAINYVLSNDEHKNGKFNSEPIIDITQLHNYDDQDFLDEFIEIFKLSAEKLSKDLNNTLENNYDIFMNVVHSIKGLSGNIGAQTLREITIEAEGLNPEDYNKYSAEYYTKIVYELLRTQAELVKYSSKK